MRVQRLPAGTLALASALLLAGCGAGNQDDGAAQANARRATQMNATPEPLPVPDAGRLSAGFGNSVAVDINGSVFTWGSNQNGQLGANVPLGSTSVPQVVLGLSGVRAVSSSSYQVLALRQDGTVFAWGSNDHGQLGNGTIGGGSLKPLPVAGLSNVRVVAAGQWHSAALANGGVWGWGTLPGRVSKVPALLPGLSGVKTVAAGADFNLALKSDGSVWGWGGNTSGQLGIARRSAAVTVPERVIGLDQVVAVSAGSTHGLALRADGTVWAWGDNTSGQLGAPGDSHLTPYRVSRLPVPSYGAAGIKAIVAGTHNSAVLYDDGSVWAWGDNSAGQLGNGTNYSERMPVRINTVSNIVAVAIGDRFMLMLAADGKVYATGANGLGQLGNHTFSGSRVPVQVVGLSGVSYLDLGKSWGL